jgi:transcriptional regulatory protein LevR
VAQRANKMKILTTELFERQLKEILETFALEDIEATKKFKLYLDTIIINIPTKAKKYKNSIYFNDNKIKDIPHEEFTIVFQIDETLNNYLILAILPKEPSS